jgi:hypothetical protein
MKTVTFELADADDNLHTYEVELFSVDENARLQLMFGQPLIRAVGNLAATLAPVVQSGAVDLDGGEIDVKAVLGAVGWHDAPDVLLPVISEIEARGGPEQVARIFERTTRLVPSPDLEGLPVADGNPIDPNFRQQLKKPEMRDMAFGDGNMYEYWRAAAMVLLVNFTRYGRQGSPSLSGLFKRLIDSFFPASPKSTATPAPNAEQPNASKRRTG